MRPYSPEAVEEAFGPEAGGPALPESTDPRELALALRQWQEENPWDDLATSFTGGTPYAAADLAASHELEEPWWMQALYAAGIIPAVGPAVKVVGKNTKKLYDILGNLPEGGVRKWLEELIKKPEFASRGDEAYRPIADMFTEDGSMRAYHGGSNFHGSFDTPGLRQILKEDRGMQIHGPALYGSTDLSTPGSYARAYTDEGDASLLYELGIPLEDVGAYLNSARPGMRDGFSRQTEQVKDIVRTLYPEASDSEAFGHLMHSPLVGDEYVTKASTMAEYEPFIDLLEGDDYGKLAANLKAEEVGLKGHFFPSEPRRPLESYLMSYDPSSLELNKTMVSTPGELSRAIRRNLKDVSMDPTEQFVLDSRTALDEIFNGVMSPQGMPDVVATPASKPAFEELLREARERAGSPLK